MCLGKLEDFPVTQSYGWQVFSKHSGDLYSRFFGPTPPIPIGEWQKDKFRIFNRWIYMDSAIKKYKKGFHIFLNEEDAQAYCPGFDTYCVKKVRFKRVLARGLQEISAERHTQMAKVVVCRKRFVEP